MILELKHIYKDYLQGKLVVPVLKDINLSVEAGEYIAIMGPSGSGKTTLMNIIGCLDVATKGSYLLAGGGCLEGFGYSYGGDPESQHRLCLPAV